LRVSNHKSRFSLSALLLAACVALSALSAPALSEEAVSGEAVMLEGSDTSVHATTDVSSA
jgi:hypothetical protein